ncbi:hypothetical protein E2C01_078389 [Portunus trituberculatus]|uniref:Uncharacterized protein n=1 Tax=Portunus trituberculatus TaxID=210409 RepID=A0A5B7IU10_PORTR|nr:hypothetical protein [Portunus trituberculatus]
MFNAPNTSPSAPPFFKDAASSIIICASPLEYTMGPPRGRTIQNLELNGIS